MTAKLYVIDFDKVENPCERCPKMFKPEWANREMRCNRLEGLCHEHGVYAGQQSILNQCVEVDLENDELYQQLLRDVEYCSGCDAFLVKTMLKSIKQFISEIKKQEGKDGKIS
jgi:hypothetical protein